MVFNVIFFFASNVFSLCRKGLLVYIIYTSQIIYRSLFIFDRKHKILVNLYQENKIKWRCPAGLYSSQSKPLQVKVTVIRYGKTLQTFKTSEKYKPICDHKRGFQNRCGFENPNISRK